MIINSNGIMETVAIRKAGYFKKMPLERFYERYHFLGVQGPDEGSIVAFLTKAIPKSLYLVGKSKIFFKELGVSQLDERRNLAIQGSARKLQCYVRRMLAMKKFEYLREIERRRREEEERRRREEEERKRREEEERRRREEEERKRREEEERRKREEEERKRREAEEKRRREEEERLRKEEEERRRKQEEERRAAEEERKRREQAEALQREQEDRHKQAMKEKEELKQRQIDDEIARQAAEFADELMSDMLGTPPSKDLGSNSLNLGSNASDSKTLGSNDLGSGDFDSHDFGEDDFDSLFPKKKGGIAGGKKDYDKEFDIPMELPKTSDPNDFGLTTADFGGFGEETAFQFRTYVPEKDKKPSSTPTPTPSSAKAPPVERVPTLDLGGVDEVLAEFDRTPFLDRFVPSPLSPFSCSS